MGKGRTTTGMILACLLKDILFGNNNRIYYKDDKVTKEEFPDEDEYLEEVRNETENVYFTKNLDRSNN